MAFSCKRRGFCPSCGPRRMVQSAAYLVDCVIPRVPVRQWVLSFPIPQRILKLLTRAGCLIEDQGMRYLAEAQSDRALTPLRAARAPIALRWGRGRGRKV